MLLFDIRLDTALVRSWYGEIPKGFKKLYG